MSMQAAPVNYPTSPTPGRSLTMQNTQSSGGQPVVLSPATTPLQLPQSMLDNYNNTMSQNMPSEWIFSNRGMSRSNIIGVGEQVSGVTCEMALRARLFVNKDVSSSLLGSQLLQPQTRVSLPPLRRASYTHILLNSKTTTSRPCEFLTSATYVCDTTMR
jgi:hypothetical protein